MGTSDLSIEGLEGAYKAIESLAKIVEQQVNNGVPKNLELSRCTMEQFKKLNPPSFKGTPNPTEAENWVMQMEKMFDVLKCTDEQRVLFGTFMLEGEAEHWWRMTKRIHGEKNNPIGWNDFL